MTHFVVAVFANDPSEFDELLAPFDENNEEYFDFIELSDDRMDFLKSIYDRLDPKKKPESFERFITDEGYVNDPVTGDVGYYANPNAAWDWYELDGGAGLFDFKEGELHNNLFCARKNQYDYKDNYPFAFITPDGEWHAPGRAGWFSVKETPEDVKAYEKEWEEWVASEENPYVSFVDCHI